MDEPLAGIPDDELNQWLHLLRTNKNEADDLYFEKILPLVLKNIETKPAHQEIRDRKCNILVSLMGFSPETTVITTSVVKPERLLIVLSGKAEDSYDRAYEFLRKHLKHSQIHQEFVDPIDPTDIYNKVKSFVDKNGHGGRHIFDVTGGKKIMSATAGQVAWELDMPLCYVEGEYDPVIRRPRPGTEKVMLLGNASQQRQENSRHNALTTYQSGNFGRAAEAFLDSSNLRTDARLEDFAIPLCQSYVAWTDLDFEALEKSLSQLEFERSKPRIAEYLRLRNFNHGHLNRQIDALRAVMAKEPLARMASYLQLAAIYRDMRRHDFACLLIYRCMEVLVQHGLKEASQGKFDGDHPVWSLLGEEATLQKGYVQLSQELDCNHQGEERLPQKVGLTNGVALLCLVSNLHDKQPNPRRAKDYVNRIRSVAKLRNQSVLAHGDKTLTSENCKEMFDRALELAEKCLQGDFEKMQGLQQWLKPLSLQELHNGMP